jgi:hypothetical protein
MIVEVIISGGMPTGTAAAIADEAVRLFGERLHLAPQDILFCLSRGGAEPPALSCYLAQTRGDRRCLSRRGAARSWRQRKELLWEAGYEVDRHGVPTPIGEPSY